MGALVWAVWGVGFWSWVGDFQRHLQKEKEFSPRLPPDAVEGIKRQWRRAVERSKNWVEE